MGNMQRRRQYREYRKEQHDFVKPLPEALTPIPPEDFPPMNGKLPEKAWKSRKFMVQQYAEGNGCFRLSVCRVRLNNAGRFEDGITWDDLQTIKREVGFGDWYGVEVYPRDEDMVNVANFRHVWLLPAPLPIGWFKK